MKAVVFDRIGPAREVLYLADLPNPPVGDGEALVRMVAAPVSPGDFLFIENLYPEPKKPRFPQQIGGNHGLGVIEQVGRNVSLQPGQWVAFSYYNTWAEFAAVPAEWLIPLPAGFAVEKGAQLFNLITAWDLLNDSRVAAGGWLAVTAGYSAVATMVLQFAKQRGIRVVPIVRREYEHLDLRALGATEVIDLSQSSETVHDRIQRVTQHHGIDGLVDNVGGPVTGELIRALAFGGQVVINGGMSPARFELHNFDILLKGVAIKAHVYRYFFKPPEVGDAELLRQVVLASGRADFMVPVGGVHSLEDFGSALERSMSDPSRGKRLLRMS
jgi:NADPH2:quinone reductase